MCKNILNNMSRLHRTNVTTTLEPAFESESEEVEEEAYQPMHPTLAALAVANALKENKPDHLDNFVEVNPFEEEEKK